MDDDDAPGRLPKNLRKKSVPVSPDERQDLTDRIVLLLQSVGKPLPALTILERLVDGGVSDQVGKGLVNSILYRTKNIYSIMMDGQGPPHWYWDDTKDSAVRALVSQLEELGYSCRPKELRKYVEALDAAVTKESRLRDHEAQKKLQEAIDARDRAERAWAPYCDLAFLSAPAAGDLNDKLVAVGGEDGPGPDTMKELLTGLLEKGATGFICLVDQPAGGVAFAAARQLKESSLGRVELVSVSYWDPVGPPVQGKGRILAEAHRRLFRNPSHRSPDCLVLITPRVTKGYEVHSLLMAFDLRGLPVMRISL